ncbi:hypothetical protein [Streptomyces sp. NPDC001985]|uniref:hypothetical protein n=1 Tax=Streptomyces sp. NPDC001985 TaxID=3154406 RepID=UPI00332B83CE
MAQTPAAPGTARAAPAAPSGGTVPPLADAGPATMSERVAPVPQSFTRRPLSARENIQLGAPRRGGDHAATAAADSAGARQHAQAAVAATGKSGRPEVPAEATRVCATPLRRRGRAVAAVRLLENTIASLGAGAGAAGRAAR